MEDLSPLRSGSRKKKVLSLPNPAARIIIACQTLHVYVFETPRRQPLVLLQNLQRAFQSTSTGS